MTLFVESYHFLKIGIIYYFYGVFLAQFFCYDRFLGFELVVGVECVPIFQQSVDAERARKNVLKAIQHLLQELNLP